MNSVSDDEKFNRKWWLNPMESEQLGLVDKRNSKVFKLWILIWGVLFFGVGKYGHLLALSDNEMPVWAWPILFSPVVATVFLIHALVRFCRDTTDELLRRMTYESLSVGFAVAFFVYVCTVIVETIAGRFVAGGHLVFAGLVLGYFVSYFLLCRKNCYV